MIFLMVKLTFPSHIVSTVDDLLDDLLDGDVDISICVGLDLLQNNLFYHFNSGSSNRLVLHTDLSLLFSPPTRFPFHFHFASPFPS
jgi:hypothetical protein